MGSVSVGFRSRRAAVMWGTAVSLGLLAVSGACGRSDLDLAECTAEGESQRCERNGEVGTQRCRDGLWSLCSIGATPSAGASQGGKGPSTGGRGGSQAGGSAGQGAGRGGAGGGALAGAAGEESGGAAGEGNLPIDCGPGTRAVLYLLSADNVITRIDAATLEQLSQIQLVLNDLNSLAVTGDGIVYTAQRLDLHRINPLTARSDNVHLDSSAFSGSLNMTLGFAPAGTVTAGGSILLVHLDAASRVNVYSAPIATFVPTLLHRFDATVPDLEITADETGRLYTLQLQGLVEYDAATFENLGSVQIPDLPQQWSGDVAYLSGQLFTVYAETEQRSRIFRTLIAPRFSDSTVEELGRVAGLVVGAGAACEAP